MEDGKKLHLASLLRDYSLQSGATTMYSAFIDEANVPYYSADIPRHSTDSTAVTITSRKFDLTKEDISRMFVMTADYAPPWGGLFVWPDNKKYIVYTDGDNAAFIAGNLREMELLLGFDYKYGLERCISANVAHRKWDEVGDAFRNFCNEFASLD
jgi:hypothetical protein